MRCIWRSNLHKNESLQYVIGYINNYYSLDFLHATKGNDLNEDEKIKNKKINKQRGIIEKYIGRIKLRFFLKNNNGLDLIYS